MTTAAGARCDHCSIVNLSEPSVGIGTVPRGWLVLYGPMDNSDPGIVEARHDFCSLDCLATWSQLSADADANRPVTIVETRLHHDAVIAAAPPL